MPIQVVIFGASGDLAARKLVPALLALAAQDPAAFRLIGVARRPLDDAGFRAQLRAGVSEADLGAFDAFQDRVHYVQGDVGGDLQPLARHLDALPGGAAAGRLFYLSLKPSLFLPAVEKETILKALEATKGDRAKAAQMLGIGRTTLYRKLKEYKIDN